MNTLSKKAAPGAVTTSRELSVEELAQVGGAYAMSDSGYYDYPYGDGGYGYGDPSIGDGAPYVVPDNPPAPTPSVLAPDSTGALPGGNFGYPMDKYGSTP